MVTLRNLAFVVVGLVWLGTARTGAGNTDLTCALFACESGGERCCIGSEFVYGCSEYCDECFQYGGQWDGGCSPDQGGGGSWCQCEGKSAGR